jgi:hypothetical protein
MFMSKSQYSLVAVALALLSAIFSLKQMQTVKFHQDAAAGIQTKYLSAAVNNNHLDNADRSSNNNNINAAIDPLPHPTEEQRRRCQIIYILGVEGTMHHGVEPIIETLARHQTDESGNPYNVVSSSDDLRYGLFGYPAGHFGFWEVPPITDPTLVSKVISSICPNINNKNDNQHYITIESTSFPSGGKHHATSRIHRQSAWHQMTPSSIANSHSALNHPTNLYEFYNAYSVYADIKFVVLHRGFLDVIASHKNFDDGPLTHANVIQGYLILLSRFLEEHQKNWMLLDMDSILQKYNRDEMELERVRREMIYKLVDFLGWQEGECWDCFDAWVDSTSDAVALLGNPTVKKLMKQMVELEGVWPPSSLEG